MPEAAPPSATPRSRLAPGVLLALSATLNVALGFHLLRSSPVARPGPPVPGAASRTPAATPRFDPVPAHAPAASAPDAALPPPFHWGAIESDDYRQYIANLRAVGCPEDTIRDLVAADLAALYLPRARAVWSRPTRAWWQKYVADQPNPDQVKALTRLAKEQDAVFRDLLDARLTQQDRIDLLYLQLHGTEQELLFLPAGTREAALAHLATTDIEERTMALHTQGSYSSADEERLFAEKLRLLAAVLSPAELEEYRLRGSPAAQQLRVELQYFECTPEEFAKILDARQASPGRVPIGDLVNRGPAAAQVREMFGEERAAEFERVTDIHYQQARQAVERYELPTELADQAAAVAREARQAADALALATDQPADARRRQIESLLAQATNRLVTVLGEAASRPLRRDLKVVLDAAMIRSQP